MSKKSRHQMSREESVEHYQLTTMVNVVFGVMVGMPLLDVPKKIIHLINNFSLTSATPILLLCSALSFCILYWFGEHEYMAQQKKFDNKIIEITKDKNIIPPVSIAYLGGIILLIIIFASILIFAKENNYRLFLIANISFWIADFVANVTTKRTYRKAKSVIKKPIWTDKENEDYWWLSGYIITNYFYFYSLGNLFIFIMFLFVDIFIIASPQYRFLFTCLILIITFLRDILWRSKYYDSWIEYKHKNAPVKTS